MDKQVIIDQLKIDEGFSAVSFWDFKQWTWGYGTKAPSGPGLPISQEDAEVELSEKVDLAIKEYKSLFSEITTEINDVRQHALVNMIYNMGAKGVSGFKNMLATIRKGDWKSAANHARASLWYKQVTRRARRICNELEKGVILNVV
jgi:GH24 family phage-related lysozyme (muramidase)